MASSNKLDIGGLCLFLLVAPLIIYAQKPIIDTLAINNWTNPEGLKMSCDGKYTAHLIYNRPIGGKTLYLQQLNDSWSKSISGARNPQFLADGKSVIYQLGKDSLCLLKLGADQVQALGQASMFRLCKVRGADLLLYQPSGRKEELVLRNLSTGKQHIYKGIERYTINLEETQMLLFCNASDGLKQIRWIDLATGKLLNIWKGSQVPEVFFHPSGNSLILLIRNKEGKIMEIREQQISSQNSVLLADTALLNSLDNLLFDKMDHISKDGKRIFLKYKEVNFLPTVKGYASVDVWSYTDLKLQSVQLKEGLSKSYLAVLDIPAKQIFRLQQENDLAPVNLEGTDEWFFFIHWKGYYSERWIPESYFLVSAKTGKRNQVPFRVEGISSDGKLAYGAKDLGGDCYSYEISSGKVYNLTAKLPIPVLTNEFDLDMPKSRNLKYSCKWYKGKDQLIIYDEYDVWLVDLKNEESPQCLTRGYGRKHRLTFRLADGIDYSKNTINKEKLLLAAFDHESKQNGFYALDVSGKVDPEELTMGDYFYFMPDYPLLQGYGMKPVKANRAKVWLLRRESGSESPNYFWTSDFKVMQPVSSNYPEKQYNWMRSEVVHFRTTDGRNNHGVLYKPENFDPRKKYPVIFHYYTKMSQYANLFERPDLCRSTINIPWMVSRGYLVFTSDILYTVGETGMSAVRSVIGAARYLAAHYSWADSTKFAIQGHSFGGYETNFIATHTNLFAAAASSAGMSNLTSGYGALWANNGSSMSEYYEFRDGDIGVSMPDQPELYIQNSPIFKVKDMVTPLLILHNKEDNAVPFAQGIELFTSMRRIGKKVWMLQYDGEGHSIVKSNNAYDYTQRLTQFFDHYLKGAPAPKWMTRGVPAKMKGIDDGLRFDDEKSISGQDDVYEN